VFGDIGCYALAVCAASFGHARVDMHGGRYRRAYGAGKAIGKDGLGKICAVLGDSTFFHSGVTR